MPFPHPRLLSHPPPGPRGSVVPTIRSHARPPLPALPASEPGVHAPSTCASFSGGNEQQRRLPNRACPPPRFPQFFMDLPGISRVLHQSPLSLGRRQPASPWQPFCRKRGHVFHRPPALQIAKRLGPVPSGKCSWLGPPCALAPRHVPLCW